MENHSQNPLTSPVGLQLWRKAGVDFDRGCKSSLAELLVIGGYFPLCKVEDRLPMSHHSLYQWSRGAGGEELFSCFVPIRAKGKNRAITILVDLVRLNNLLAAQVKGRISGQIPEPAGTGSGPAISKESA